jgi:tape measure domain-containing protein
MATRTLGVKFSTEGFNEAIASVKKVGQAFDESLAKSQQAVKDAVEASKKASEAGDTKAFDEAEAARVKAARQANQTINNSFRELRVKQEADINIQKDQAISAFNAIKNSGVASARDIANAEVALKKRLEELDKQLDQTGKNYKTLGIRSTAEIKEQKQEAIAAYKAIRDSGVASSQDIANAKRALKQQLKELNGELKNVQNGFTVFKGVVANLSSSAIIGGIQSISSAVKNLIGNVIDAGTTAERQAVSFETFLGSKEKAAKVLADIRNFAATTQFQLPEVTDAGKQLLAAGFGAEELIPTLKMVAEVATAADKPLSQVLFIYAQIKNQGKAMAGDINQLYNAGLGAKDFAKALNISEEAVKELASQGKIRFAEVKKVFESLTSEGGRFYGLIDKLSDTTGTKLSNLEDAFGAIYRSIYQGIEPAISSVLDVIVGTIAPLGESKDLWDGIRAEALNFQSYIKDNPAITKELGDQLKSGVSVVMTAIVGSAKDLLGYLKQNPTAVLDTIGKVGTLIEVIKSLIGLLDLVLVGWQKISNAVSEAATLIRGMHTGGAGVEGTRNFVEQNAGEEGVKEFDRRYKEAQKPRLGGNWDFLIPGKKEKIAEEIAQDILLKQASERRAINNNAPQIPNFDGPAFAGSPILPVPKIPQTKDTTDKLPPPPDLEKDGKEKKPKELTDDQKFAAKTIQIANNLNIDPLELMTMMLFESKGTLSPSIQGPEVPGKGKGRGLIQIMPATARGLGTSDAKLAKMTPLKQLDYVEKYFAQFKGNFGEGKLENLYAAVLAGDPRKVNASDGYTTAREGAKTMVKNFGDRAAKLLGSVPSGEALSNQYEFDDSIQDEARRKVEEKRRSEDEVRNQQQELTRSSLEVTQQQELNQFDKNNINLTGGQIEASTIARSELIRRQQYAREVLEIEQKIYNLTIERQQKIEDNQNGLPTTNKDLTAEIQALEQRKQLLKENYDLQSQQQAGLLNSELGNKTEEINQKLLELNKTLKDNELSLEDDTPEKTEAAAFAQIADKYDEYKKSIEEAIKSIASLIEFKTALGYSTEQEKKAIEELKKQYEELNRTQAKDEGIARTNKQDEINSNNSEFKSRIGEYNSQIEEDRASKFEDRGDPFTAAQIRENDAVVLENERYRQEIEELEGTYRNQPQLLDELKRKAQEVNLINLGNIREEFKDLGETITDVLADNLAEASFKAITEFKSLGDVLLDLWTGVWKSIAQVAAQNVANIVSSGVKDLLGGNKRSDSFGDATIPRYEEKPDIATPLVSTGFSFVKSLFFADGGLVSGEGTGTSDSIPARLSNGEFVVRASSVGSIGTRFLNELNQTGRIPSLSLKLAGEEFGGSSSQQITFNQPITVVTPDANSFGKTNYQIAQTQAEMARRAITRR